jgi:hypothetical protein
MCCAFWKTNITQNIKISAYGTRSLRPWDVYGAAWRAFYLGLPRAAIAKVTTRRAGAAISTIRNNADVVMFSVWIGLGTNAATVFNNVVFLRGQFLAVSLLLKQSGQALQFFGGDHFILQRAGKKKESARAFFADPVRLGNNF